MPPSSPAWSLRLARPERPRCSRNRVGRSKTRSTIVALLQLGRTPLMWLTKAIWSAPAFDGKQEEVLHGSDDNRRRASAADRAGRLLLGQRAFTSAKSMNHNATLLFLKNQAAFDLTNSDRWRY